MDLLLLIVPFILCIIAQINVTSTYNRYHKVRNARGLTGAETARRILDLNGLTHVQIERISGNLTDHYDPAANIVRLSDSVYDKATVAALGVAAHECGHAIQHAQQYVPVLLRSKVVPVASFCSRIWYFVFLIGLFASQFLGSALLWLAVILFAAVALFQFVTLPVEFNASRRAMHVLETQGFLEGEEVSGARKVLTAAALTYVAALVQSLAQLLRLIGIAKDD